VQIPPSRPGPSLRESGVGGGEATISHQHGVWLLTLEPRSEIGIGIGIGNGRSFRDRRTEPTVDRNSVSCCSVSAFVWTREHMFAVKREVDYTYLPTQ
jgi:hypothetical protein